MAAIVRGISKASINTTDSRYGNDQRSLPRIIIIMVSSASSKQHNTWEEKILVSLLIVVFQRVVMCSFPANLHPLCDRTPYLNSTFFAFYTRMEGFHIPCRHER
ncbi:unnamed protein product [Albugo candida]|uniref:Uncharacterized protein n=1 Tax=Albugo candida TaxID=65357 RepID=A0A024FVL1_9STRA|nr:unnamed protein product [Albugo candida]|eukprot:CCI10942.1 unnamed protein product [Albugo candida]